MPKTPILPKAKRNKNKVLDTFLSLITLYSTCILVIVGTVNH
jgi:hypothetical protein